MISRIWNSLEETIIGLLLVSMTLLVFVEVFMRFVLNTGFLVDGGVNASPLGLDGFVWRLIRGARGCPYRR